MKNFYEITCLLPDRLNESETKAAQDHIKEIIEKNGGKIKQEFSPKRIDLAYPIKKEKKAYLISFDFYNDSRQSCSIKEAVRKEPNILRFIVVKKIEEKEKPVAKPPAKTPSPKKVDLKDLDKKLEEILAK